MKKYLISINDLPPDGKNFSLDDQEIWLDPLREFKMDCRIEEPLKANLFVMPADSGVLVRGDIEGKVVVPCNRCTEDASVSINTRFDEYEEIPQANSHAAKNGEGHVIYDRGAPMLDLGEVLWEQFMLAMPARPLCREDCKGLCVQCGTNLNLGECSCSQEEGDPRMAAFRQVKIAEKK